MLELPLLAPQLNCLSDVGAVTGSTFLVPHYSFQLLKCVSLISSSETQSNRRGPLLREMFNSDVGVLSLAC